MLALLLLTLAAPDRTVLDLSQARSETVTISYPADGVARLTQPRVAEAYAVVGQSFAVSPVVVAAGAEIRCGALWNRDAKIVIELLDEAGKSISRSGSSPIYRTTDWTAVQVHAAVPTNATSARLLIGLSGEVTPNLDAASWAEFRGLECWPAPPVTLAGPPIGLVKPTERWTTTLEVGMPAAHWSARLLDIQGEDVARWEGAPGRQELSHEPLPPGYYELRWSALDGEGRSVRAGRMAYACLPDWTPPERSPFAMDAGFSWGMIQKGEPQAKAVAELLYRVGLRRTRDRMSLSGTMTERGKLVLGPYARAAQLQHDAGLRVYTIIHDIPPWMAVEPGHREAHRQPPADLRDLHAWFAAASREMAGTVDAWELWNEPDISFFAGRAEEYAGIVKAGYLGLKAGNPNAQVLLGSPAHALGPWIRLAYESGIADYYDLFNFHTYRKPETIPADTAEFRALQQRHGVDRPIWLTETGATATPEAGDELPGERFQAIDYVKRYALAASQRIENVFAFYLQEWRQSGAPPFGVLRPDLSPRPALVSLATLTRMLGEGRPLGRQNDLPASVTALWFETGHGPVAIVWAEADVPTPAKLAGRQWVTVFGPERTPPELLTTRPLYLVADRAPAALDPPPPPPVARTLDAAELASLQVVLDLRLTPQDDLDWALEARKEPVAVAPGQTLSAVATAYNFGARPATVRLAGELPAGWTIEGLPPRVAVAPGERQIVPLTIHVAGLPREEPYAIRLTGEADGFRIAPAVAGCGPATAKLEAIDMATIGAATPVAQRWTVSSNAAMVTTLAPDGDGIVYRATMNSPSGDRWGFAQLRVAPEERLADGEGLRFRLTVPEPWGEPLLVILHEADGSQYHAAAGAMEPAGEREVRLLWTGFRLNTGVSQDENGQLDLDQVDRIGFGTSARGPQTAGAFRLGPVTLFRLRREP